MARCGQGFAGQPIPNNPPGGPHHESPMPAAGVQLVGSRRRTPRQPIPPHGDSIVVMPYETGNTRRLGEGVWYSVAWSSRDKRLAQAFPYNNGGCKLQVDFHAARGVPDFGKAGRCPTVGAGQDPLHARSPRQSTRSDS